MNYGIALGGPAFAFLRPTVELESYAFHLMILELFRII